MSSLDPQTRAVVRAIAALTEQVQRLADAQPPTEGAPPVRDDSAPCLLRVLVDRAVRGVLSMPGEGEALRRRTEQIIAGRATWKAKAEEIEQDRNDWRSRAEELEAATDRVREALARLHDKGATGAQYYAAVLAALDGTEQPTTEV